MSPQYTNIIPMVQEQISIAEDEESEPKEVDSATTKPTRRIIRKSQSKTTENHQEWDQDLSQLGSMRYGDY